MVLLVASASAPGADRKASTPMGPTEIKLNLFPARAFLQDTLPLPPRSPADLQGKKSVGLAAIYSLLLPGLGELYAGGFGSGKYFLIAEGGLWLTYAGFETYGNALRDDARSFAVQHAQVNASGKDDQFFVDVSNYLNVNDYNQAKLQQRELNNVYDPAAGYAWQWDSDASRATFKSQRILSENVYNDRKFVAAFIIINHVASAINAARAAIAHNKEIDNPFGNLDMSARLLGGSRNPNGILITIAKPL